MVCERDLNWINNGIEHSRIASKDWLINWCEAFSKQNLIDIIINQIFTYSEENMSLCHNALILYAIIHWKHYTIFQHRVFWVTVTVVLWVVSVALMWLLGCFEWLPNEIKRAQSLWYSYHPPFKNHKSDCLVKKVAHLSSISRMIWCIIHAY